MVDTATTQRESSRDGLSSLPLPIVLWAFGLFLLPFYVFDSGLPQPAHFVLLGAVITAQIQYRSPDPRYASFLRAMGLLVLVIAVVTITQSMFTPADVSLMPPVFALFNLLVVRAALTLHSHLGTRFLDVTARSFAAILVLLAAITVLMSGDTGLRTTVTFNNPNQQAYFALSAASVLAGIAFVNRLNWKLQVASYVSAVLLLAAANSKAGLAAMVLLVVLVALTRPRIAVAVALLGLIVVLMTSFGAESYRNVQIRVADRQGDETLEARGYDLLAEYPVYLVVGSGEGYRQRFGRVNEIHSTLGTVAFAYGIVGLAAFAAIFIRLFRLSRFLGLMLVGPAMLYGLAHNGLRFTVFWVLISVIGTLGPSLRTGRSRLRSVESRSSGRASRAAEYLLR